MLTNEERKWLQERGDSPLFQCEKYCEYHVGKDSYFECTYSPALSQEWCKNDAGNPGLEGCRRVRGKSGGIHRILEPNHVMPYTGRL